MTPRSLSADVLERAARVRLVATDCDGVLTDGGVYCNDDGEALLRFNRRDGAGIERLREAGIDTVIITRESSPVVARRAEKIGVRDVRLGVRDKLAAVTALAAERGVPLENVAYVGDDVYDVAAMEAVGLSACPADADASAVAAADVVLHAGGGRGAVREVADLVLSAAAGVYGGTHPHTEQRLHLVPAEPRRWCAVGDRAIGEGEPVYVIAEIGINHNGSIDLTKKLIDGAVAAGCDAVKFQKRTPELCVPADQQNVERDTPWGRITYLEYRRKVEFNFSQYAEIDRYCRERRIAWTASAWDEPSVDFLAAFDVPFLKVPSAALTDHALLHKMRSVGCPVMLSTGMSTEEEIGAAVEVARAERLLLAHATSTYPCPPRELNLQMIRTLETKYPGIPVGYSGHEVGLATTNAAVALGAAFVERHITLDRSMWGSDQSASVEIVGLMRLVRDIRDIEQAKGDGVKRVYASELPSIRRLRRVSAVAAQQAATA